MDQEIAPQALVEQIGRITSEQEFHRELVALCLKARALGLTDENGHSYLLFSSAETKISVAINIQPQNIITLPNFHKK